MIWIIRFHINLYWLVRIVFIILLSIIFIVNALDDWREHNLISIFIFNLFRIFFHDTFKFLWLVGLNKRIYWGFLKAGVIRIRINWRLVGILLLLFFVIRIISPFLHRILKTFLIISSLRIFFMYSIDLTTQKTILELFLLFHFYYFSKIFISQRLSSWYSLIRIIN